MSTSARLGWLYRIKRTTDYSAPLAIVERNLENRMLRR